MRAALVKDGVITNLVEVSQLSDIAGAQFISTKSTLQIGDEYQSELAFCGDEPPVIIPNIQLSGISVNSANARLIGKIWWVPKTEAFTITATANGLPNGGLMVMVERVLNGYQPIDDIRFVATIENGQVTMQGKFEQSGNYIITAKRLNKGLERIGAPFRLEFETMEFDAYVTN
ncbi:hypothetical protein CBQ28_04365 [Pseudoalteromonas sp. GCY]|uniref:DUF4369 domain-containing protein n=1 Tax=Pseudoalteromonas sp. GCY TaxID=2003316 RepID=UPI000BFECA2F|nr:DUF4369 domain-containing protein [Pseudoalteromonas sp. GCY]PHI38323.1 hypothetical protein CBQ28_04365 [Pseudoalteromonas sp. GCY]QQQ65635.1 DUF4369 domain-containing protein [Pseudoalteromonas sp. GCY]